MEIEKFLELIEKGKCLILTAFKHPTRIFYKMIDGTYHIDTFRGFSLLGRNDGLRPCKTYKFDDFLVEIEKLKEIIKVGKTEIN